MSLWKSNYNHKRCFQQRIRNVNTIVQHPDVTLYEILDTILFIHIQDAQTKWMWRIRIKVIEEHILNHTQENLSRNMKTEH